MRLTDHNGDPIDPRDVLTDEELAAWHQHRANQPHGHVRRYSTSRDPETALAMYEAWLEAEA